jgi:hypothetical protein
MLFRLLRGRIKCHSRVVWGVDPAEGSRRVRVRGRCGYGFKWSWKKVCFGGNTVGARREIGG